jgi:hypothetical protein
VGVGVGAVSGKEDQVEREGGKKEVLVLVLVRTERRGTSRNRMRRTEMSGVRIVGARRSGRRWGRPGIV